MAVGNYSFTISVSYNANNGSNAPSANSKTNMSSSLPYTMAITLQSGKPSRTGYTFLGWSTSNSASSASYSAGGSLSHEFTTVTEDGTASYSVTLYAVWRANTYTVSYKKGSNGTGTNTTDTKTHGVDLTLKNAIFTRTGYDQTGWSTSDGGSKAYNLGGKYTANAAISLYPFWSAKKSTFTVTSSVPADGSTNGTVTITRYVSSFTHKVKITLGSNSQTIQDVGTSTTFTIPANWVNEIPSATSATATIEVTTYSGSTNIGANSKTFTITVPASVKPTIQSFTGTNQSDNATVTSWGILVQGYSTILLSVSATAGTGSTIQSIAFSGYKVSQSGTATSVTSSLLKKSGEQSWTVTVTDARGRSSSQTISRMVYRYYTPSISRLSALRCDSLGNEDTVGRNILVSPKFGIASCDGNNSAVTSEISYKVHESSTYTTAVQNAVSESSYVIGSDSIDITHWYDVKFKLVDTLGNTAEFVVQIPTAMGVSFGLNGQCARFGGPVQYDDRFECDWLAQFDDDVEILGDLIYGSHRIFKSLWSDYDNGWDSGNITVNGIADYTMLVVRFIGLGTSALVFITEESGNKYFRGEGGYATSANGETRIYIGATLSGDTLTMGDCHQIKASGARTARKVAEIIGII